MTSVALRWAAARSSWVCRLVAGAQATRDMIDAWLDSANTPVGYPMVNVRDIESGKVRATRELFGD
jgi:hypothetical protein